MIARLRPGTVIAAPCLAALVCGCTSVLSEGTSAAAGVTAAGITRGATRNAAVITGIGLGVQAVARAGLHYTEREVHRTEQDRIAAVAGSLEVGAIGKWQVVHTIPIEADEHGEVTVSRMLGGGGIVCKEIVFSVDHLGKDGHPGKAGHPGEAGVTREFYTATVCRDGNAWKWATAEPATERWGGLQ
jgi:hypothetical protein